MKKKVSVILSSVLIFSMLSMGLLCLSDVIKQSVEKSRLTNTGLRSVNLTAK